MNRIMLFGLLVVGLALSACDRAPPNPGAVSSSNPSAEEQAPAMASVSKEVEVRTGPYTLNVRPGRVCKGERVRATLDWQIDDPAVGDWIEVRVRGPGEVESKTFTQGARSGSAETGDWVMEGTRFSVINPKSGKELVAYTVTTMPCQ